MDKRARASSTSSPSPYQIAPMHGGDLMLGSMLGQMIAGQHNANELLRAITDRLSDLPDQIAERMSEKLSRPEPSAPVPPPQDGKVMSYMKTTKELLQAALPLALLTALVMGKVTWSDVLPLIRTALGAH